MRDETLLDRAISNLNGARLLLQNNEDDAYVNFAAYHTQQAYELLLKHSLEINGIRFMKEHDIRMLIEQCIKADIVFPYNTYLDEQADVITLMESKTRYVKNYFYSKTVVERAINNCESLIDVSKKLNDITITDCHDSVLSDLVCISKNVYPNLKAKNLIEDGIL